MSQIAVDRSKIANDDGGFESPVLVQGQPSPSASSTPSFWRREVTVLSVLTLAFTFWYSTIFYNSISAYWFHPAWTTDDALQQVYPFYEALIPGLFDGDLITDVMRGYLAPAHYWLCYGITKLTGDPIMMSHWVMLIQVALTIGFLFAAVRFSAGTVPALFSVVWLLHTRHVMQRLTGGLPRGWGAPIFAAFLYFAFKGNHAGVLATLLLGCLLNPPATMVVAVTYGMVLVWKWCASSGEERTTYTKRFLSYAAASPFLFLVTLAVVYQPPSIGQMVSFDVASTMPEFSRPYGRFPFIPFNPASEEIRVFGLQAFMGRFFTPARMVREWMPHIVLGSLALVVLIGLFRKRKAIPSEVLLFGCGSLTVYFLSRILAFRLYVPNRHLQIPLAIFFITAFTIGAWRALHRAGGLVTSGTTGSGGGLDGGVRDSSFKVAWPSAVALSLLAGLVFLGSNLNLMGAMNFNYSLDKKGRVFQWIKSHTPEQALIAGHPTHIDAMQLFAARRAYVTTETTHPFYTRYYAEMKRRTEIALRAHYSASLEELVRMVEPEGVAYFVFKRTDFRPDVLPKLTFFPPFDVLMKELVSRPPAEYAYRQLPQEVDVERFPFMPFKDRESAVVDIQALRLFLATQQEKK
jgi:hypothetical protein